MHSAVPSKPTREEVAKLEIGRTAVSRPVAAWLAACFLAIIFGWSATQAWHEQQTDGGGLFAGAPPVVQSLRRLPERWRESTGRPWVRRVQAANAEVQRGIADTEARIEETSWFAARLLPACQVVLYRGLGAGNEKVYAGREGWLFYRPEIDYLTGPGFLGRRHERTVSAAQSEWTRTRQPDPVRAILEFHRQLRARGIDLFVLPVPAKPAIHPEYFSAFRTPPARPLENPSFAAWVDQLQAAGVGVIDAGAVLLAAARAENRLQYLATDTHWRPEAMDRVAQAAARAIADLPGWSGPEVAYRRDGDTLSQDGDLVPMLKLPARFAPPSETVEIQTVLTPRRELWRPAVDAPVLVLGDSFCNIYSLSAMGWGSGAGFAEQLSFHLGRPVDRLVRNDDGAWATRQMLSRELALGRDRLAGKRAVIWVFAERELALGDWREIPMTAGHPPARRFLEMAPGRELLVTGVVAAVSAVPVPGSVPYRDHIAAVHVVDLPAEQGPEAAKSEAVVYLWSMQNNVLQPGARLQPGQSVSLRLSAWADVASERDAINRSELEDGELQWQEPLWGELTND